MKRLLSFKVDPITKSVANQSGQAVVEYILMLVITLALILGGVYQFNDAFRQWASNYFGEYLSCIMETGELPTISGGGGGGECNQLYEEFSIANGRPLIETGGGGGGDGDGNGSGDGGGSGNGDGNGDDGNGNGNGDGSGNGEGNGGDSANGASDGASGGGRGARFASRKRGKGSGRNGRFGQGEDGEDEGGGRRKFKAKKAYTGSTEASVPGGVSPTNERRFKRRRKYGYGGGVYGYDEEEEGFDSEGGVGTVKKSEARANKAKQRVLIRKKVKKTVIEEDESMTIGGFLRYIIIAAIIIAILLFFGGQALQLGKSMD